eukprot:Pgem_evm1s1340
MQYYNEKNCDTSTDTDCFTNYSLYSSSEDSLESLNLSVNNNKKNNNITKNNNTTYKPATLKAVEDPSNVKVIGWKDIGRTFVELFRKK